MLLKGAPGHHLQLLAASHHTHQLINHLVRLVVAHRTGDWRPDLCWLTGWCIALAAGATHTARGYLDLDAAPLRNEFGDGALKKQAWSACGGWDNTGDMRFMEARGPSVKMAYAATHC